MKTICIFRLIYKPLKILFARSYKYGYPVYNTTVIRRNSLSIHFISPQHARTALPIYKCI